MFAVPVKHRSVSTFQLKETFFPENKFVFSCSDFIFAVLVIKKRSKCLKTCICKYKI